VNVEIVSLTPFGAFAQIMPGIDGLIHISQIARERVANAAQVLSVGQKVDAKITDIDEDKNRISLSIKELLEPLPEELAAEGDNSAAPPSDEPAADEPAPEPIPPVEKPEPMLMSSITEVDLGSPREQSEVDYSDDDVKPDEATGELTSELTGELPVQGDDATI
jgi:predicted RNA-binding protein with RPS1 domain